MKRVVDFSLHSRIQLFLSLTFVANETDVLVQFVRRYLRFHQPDRYRCVVKGLQLAVVPINYQTITVCPGCMTMKAHYRRFCRIIDSSQPPGSTAFPPLFLLISFRFMFSLSPCNIHVSLCPLSFSYIYKCLYVINEQAVYTRIPPCIIIKYFLHNFYIFAYFSHIYPDDPA